MLGCALKHSDACPQLVSHTRAGDYVVELLRIAGCSRWTCWHAMCRFVAAD
jgi:hypothetical protein